MKERYDFAKIEKKWQTKWEETGAFKVTEDENQKKYYVLEMFPYPSGKLHMGHVRNYSIGDVVARFKKMQGFNVLHPMGYDSFGLPAENAAIKHGVEPAKWTYENMDEMTRQLKELGLSYDWDRMVATCKPDYYKWMQWIFIQFYKKGLAYKKDNPVNWCPSCKTVLANEQVVDGKCERCGTPVGKKNLSPVVLQDYGLCGPAAFQSGQAARLAGKGQDDAEKLDRQKLRCADFLPHRGFGQGTGHLYDQS